MLKNRFFKLFATLTAKELRSFEGYINGMYGEQSIALTLFKHLKKEAPHFDHPQRLSSDYIMQKVLKLKSGRAKRVANEYFKLSKWLEEFLILEKMRTQTSFEKDLFLIRIYHERNLQQEYDKKIKRAKKQLKKAAQKDADHHWRSFLLYFNTYFSSAHKKYQKKETNLQEANLHLDQFYALTKTMLSIEIDTRHQIVNENREIPKLEETCLHYLQNQSDHPVAELFVDLYQYTQKKTDTDIDALKTKFAQQLPLMNQQNAAIIWGFLLNLVSFELKAGDSAAKENMFALYQLGLDKHLIGTTGPISSTIFNNIVDLGCTLNQYEWVKTFIKQKQNLLRKEDQAAVVNLALANVHFYQKEFDLANQILLQLLLFDPPSKLRVYCLLIACQYEFQNYDDLNNRINAFKRFLNRSTQISDSNHKAALNFVKIVRLLVNVNQQDKAILQAKLQKMKFLFLKTWLNEKINWL
ncbi:MAG: hypothetical protein AAF985_18795 [Bacteroidota bacterium]